jgi:hypothetical protein
VRLFIFVLGGLFVCASAGFRFVETFRELGENRARLEDHCHAAGGGESAVAPGEFGARQRISRSK